MSVLERAKACQGKRSSVKLNGMAAGNKYKEIPYVIGVEKKENCISYIDNCPVNPHIR